MKEGKNGVTSATPKNIFFGAGTIHKNLVFNSTWNFESSLIGSTSGGSKLSIVPEITKVEVDGVLVSAKGLEVKTGEKATMEVNFIELTKDILKAAAFATDGTSTDSTYDLLESKASIAVGDYWDNIAFVGENLEGKKMIVILPNVICTSGFETEGKNKEGSVGKYTFECHAELTSDLDKLPWKVYYPKA